MENAPETVVTLCSQCAPDTFARDADALRVALTRAGLAVTVRGQGCLNCCGAPRALAIHAPGDATCVFDGVDPSADLADIIRTVAAYLEADRGWIEDATQCGRLRFLLRARVAAL